MAVDNTAKKSNFLTRVVANHKEFKAARDAAIALREERSSDAAISGVALTNADCIGANAHLTVTIVDDFLGVTGDIEKCLTNQTVVQSNRLPSFLAPNDGTS